eukprot:9498448-Pyramimonas_sp.AAC.2
MPGYPAAEQARPRSVPGYPGALVPMGSPSPGWPTRGRPTESSLSGAGASFVDPVLSGRLVRVRRPMCGARSGRCGDKWSKARLARLGSLDAPVQQQRVVEVLLHNAH